MKKFCYIHTADYCAAVTNQWDKFTHADTKKNPGNILSETIRTACVVVYHLN